jgi:hypothetical protein
MPIPRTHDRSRSVFGWPSGFVEEVQDVRETLRLEAVGLASEVATQAARIEETLRRVPGPDAQALATRAGELATRAWAVLQPDAGLHQAGEDVLLDTLLPLRREQRTMLRLREEADELARSGRPERHTVWAALRAGFGRDSW